MPRDIEFLANTSALIANKDIIEKYEHIFSRPKLEKALKNHKDLKAWIEWRLAADERKKERESKKTAKTTLERLENLVTRLEEILNAKMS